MVKEEDWVGRRFNKLEVISFNCRYKYKTGTQLQWNCRCDCGNIVVRSSSTLNKLSNSSCGCAKRERESYRYIGYEDISGHTWSSFKSNAKTRKLPFEITVKQVWDLFLNQNRKCALSGIDIHFGDGRKGTASLDRIDSKLGYTIDNVQVVHKIVNIMKNNSSDDEFLAWCYTIAFNNEMAK